MSEREWTDQFGTHWEVRQVGGDGRIYSQVLTKTLGGWPDREAARTGVAQAAAASRQALRSTETR